MLRPFPAQGIDLRRRRHALCVGGGAPGVCIVARIGLQALAGASALTVARLEPAVLGLHWANGGLEAAQALVQQLKKEGVEVIFALPGVQLDWMFDALYDAQDSIRVVHARNEQAVSYMADGYARATGKPMVAIVHNLVGLLHSNLAIYYAYIDRAPVFIIGATGPMDETKRRPRIDWTHTALVQGNAVRDYVKWDDMPVSLPHFAESAVRAFLVAAAALLAATPVVD